MLHLTLHQLRGWYQTLHYFLGCQYEHNRHLQKSHFLKSSNQSPLHRGKHHTNFSQVQNNHVSPTVYILIPGITTHVPLLWHSSSYRSMIVTFFIYIIHSLNQSKLIILSALKILSSFKLASQTRLVY